ncbi:MAG: hypothetical protein ACLGPL_02335 [Acidobacteriota bacterium]
MRHKQVSLSIILMVAVVALPALSHASSGYVNNFKAQYPSSAAALQACGLCHTSAPALNNYGSDFAGSHDFVAIEPNDSDGDGFNNITEINGGTMPGDISSKPTSTTPTGSTGGSTGSTGTGGSTGTTGTGGTCITLPTNPTGTTVINIYNGWPTTSTGGTPAGGTPTTPSTGTPSTGTPTTGSNAAACITCHSDGRSGATPSGHPDITGILQLLATDPGSSPTDNSAVCSSCHGGGRSGTIPGDHPNLAGGSLSGGGDDDDEGDDD